MYNSRKQGISPSSYGDSPDASTQCHATMYPKIMMMTINTQTSNNVYDVNLYENTTHVLCMILNFTYTHRKGKGNYIILYTIELQVFVSFRE